LFDATVLVRGLWQGAGLLALLFGVYAWSRQASASDDVARAMTFTVLVLSNIGLIYVNQTWDAAFWQARQGINRYSGWMAVSTVVLLAVVLAFPDVARLFAFVRPSAPMLLGAVGAAIVSMLWFEAVKRRHVQANHGGYNEQDVHLRN
jgi:Ca2+-transporting ATPase